MNWNIGMVADDPTIKIDLKIFHCQIQNDHDAITEEESAYQEIPPVRQLNSYEILINYQRIKDHVKMLIEQGTAAAH
ncbi:MAG: hypothetical protein V4560_00220 [Bacteroidota bacterium]